MISLSFLAALFAGLVRSGVGAGLFPRAIFYPLIGIAVAVAGFGFDLWGISFAAVAVGTLWLGYTKWEDPAYMVARYGIPPLVLALVSGYFTHEPYPIFWAICCAVVGAVYQALLEEWENISFELFGLAIDGNRLVEFIAGFVIIGGVAFL
jgi:hypothetical protein